ncbi:MAG: hypothetical protein KDA79_24735, partial [Planctomycetaceae bacterium]|nr:hypothetical protein [Planctomycetaceae bacterium]
GRRGGNSDQKRILDILSYEARAAVHRCYSAVWVGIIDTLSECDGWSAEADRFHKLWHLDQCWQGDDEGRSNFHLFHGHIFGLHPACADFVETPTGRQLIGEWLASGHDPSCGQAVGIPDSAAPQFERLLGGILIAVMAYASRHQDTAENRRRQEWSAGGSEELEQIQEKQVERRTGRRRPGR